MNRTGVTRRQLAAAVLAVPAAAQTPAQTPAAKPADELEAARVQALKTSEALRSFKVPQLLEPSFAFRP